MSFCSCCIKAGISLDLPPPLFNAQVERNEFFCEGVGFCSLVGLILFLFIVNKEPFCSFALNALWCMQASLSPCKILTLDYSFNVAAAAVGLSCFLSCNTFLCIFFLQSS